MKKKIKKQENIIQNNEKEFMNEEDEINKVVSTLRPNKKELYFDENLIN